MNDPQQLSLAIQAELIHLTATALLGVFAGISGLVGWTIRRDIRRYDAFKEDYQEVRDKVNWCKTVLEQAGFVRPIGPGIGGRS